MGTSYVRNDPFDKEALINIVPKATAAVDVVGVVAIACTLFPKYNYPLNLT